VSDNWTIQTRKNRKARSTRYGKTATDNIGYIPEKEGDFLQHMFVCNQIMIIMIHIILCFSTVLTILGLFAQLQTMAISFITPVWLHGKTLLPLDGFSWNLISEQFSKICHKNSSFIKTWQQNGYFKWRAIYIFDLLTYFFLEWDMFHTKVVEKIETHFMFNNSFLKIVSFTR
jgi:hypothetical protein